MATTALIGALRVTLGLDSASFERGVRKSRNEMTGFQGHVQKAAGAIKTAIAGMVAWETVQQLRDMTRAAVDAAGGLGEQAAALGVSTRSLQEYRYAATQVGLEQSEMDKGLEQLTRRLGEAAQGVKEPLDALERLGISIEDIKAMLSPRANKLAGAIAGRALYDGRVDPAEALELIRSARAA